jgi:DNA phosphorothioation-associated putative methyltransferase
VPGSSGSEDTSVPTGKKVHGDLYFHISALGQQPGWVQELVASAQSIGGLSLDGEFNVVKLARMGSNVSLLRYSAFIENPFPRLETVWTINLIERSCKQRRYPENRNAPILHKKELLLPVSHPDRERFVALTQALDERGLSPKAPGLGFRNQWAALLKSEGVAVRNHVLISRDP